MKVLMATDGSVHAATAMLTASKLLRIDKMDVDVVCVGDEPALVGVASNALLEYKKQSALSARKTLEEAQRLLSQLHVRSSGLLETGSPADKLLALSPFYDLTIVGAYGKHERKQPGLGPVASRLLQQGRGNIMVGRELVNERNFRVLTALDSSESSIAAMEMLYSLFDSASLEVTLMHVIEMPWATFSCETAGDDESDGAQLRGYHKQLERELRLTANFTMEKALRRLEQWGIRASSVIKEGDPALELSSEADQGGYDLVIAGATGASDVKHALLGSVSLKITWDCPSSVAIFRQASS
jgi:nucleotide-binding universal stress UspA family protein